LKGLADFQLQTIRSVHPKNAGKIFQTLLAITFCRLDFRVKNHLSQGVDIDIWNHPSLSNFSIEVKSTTTDTVWLYQKDFQDWEKKLVEGYRIAFAVLRLDVHGRLGDRSGSKDTCWKKLCLNHAIVCHKRVTNSRNGGIPECGRHLC
jgi:hypothetical protein